MPAPHFDRDGRLRVRDAPLSKARIDLYLGREIRDWETLNLDPKRTYRLLRHPDELARAAGLFNSLPILCEHVPTGGAFDASLIAGCTGNTAEFVDPYLYNSILLWSRRALGLVERNEARELSCGYHWRADMRPGTWSGAAYDGVMRDLRPHHVAIVDRARSGRDMRI
jgi:hypothetical protein